MEGLGTRRPKALRSLKQELNLHGIEREDDSPTFRPVEHAGGQKGNDIAMHGLDIASG